mgnify:CR=1 FL=1
MNIELHILQNFAPSCLNRDDTNTPKSCFFGGVPRARISSQCFKRAIRLHMRDALSIPTGVRTRQLAGIPQVLVAQGFSLDDAVGRTKQALTAAGVGLDADRTLVGLYLAADEVERLAAAIVTDWDALVPPEEAEGAAEAPKARGRGKGAKSGVEAPAVVEAFKNLGNKIGSADIALYGRMMAETTNMNVDAACQVAQAISTHRVDNEEDFFTAVDDLQPAEDTGAGMMGHQEFNSACFYRYALVETSQLVSNLNGDTELARRTISAFVRASIEARPSAKQNSHAAQNPPSFVQVVVGADLPMSLANAFETPVATGYGASLVQGSIDALTSYQQALRTAYDNIDHGDTYAFQVGGEGSQAALLAALEAEIKELN